jgi:hypothetical protein
VKAAAVALLSFTLAGCAPAAHPMTAHASIPLSPVSQWEDVSDDDADDTLGTTAEEDGANEDDGESSASADGSPASTGQGQDANGEPFMLGGLDPEVIHRARIEMARAALIEENSNKERVDLAEELQRELATLQATSQSSKSRTKHGGPPKKQP